MERDQISIMRQVVLGGASKYMINGQRAQQDSVQGLFQSVGLNINNPNFIIMQGRVTKVLNMKATEILAMLEEAAGTRMFEDRKAKAMKTMAKKENKVQELTNLLEDEIKPKLDKLRREKHAFLQFQKTQSDLERLTRLVVAYDYMYYQDKQNKSTGGLDALKQRKIDLETSEKVRTKEIEKLQEQIEEVENIKNRELRKGGKFQALEAGVQELSHDMVRLATQLDLKRGSRAEEEERRGGFESSVEALEQQLRAKAHAYESLEKEYQDAHEELSRQKAEIEKKEELLQTLQTGVSSREGQGSGYQGQLQEAQKRASDAATEQEQKRVQIEHLQKQIKEDEPKARKAKEQNSGLLKELEKLKAQAKKLEADLARMGYREERETEMNEEESRLQARIRELQQQADGLRRRVANINFSYADPTPGFDRSRVKGLVAELFTLEKQHAEAGTALEVCAGGRLYNVVVDTAETGTQLLQNGKLKKRVTIIPLNKISAFRASAQKVGAAQNIAPGKVGLALSLIGYDKEVTAAMEYVFGSTLICQDAETAKRVTFDPAVRMKSVTLEGDVYDPSGTLSGGSAPQTSGVLLTLQKLSELTRELRHHENQLQNLRATREREQKAMQLARQTKQQLELTTHQIKLGEEQISSNSSSSIINALEENKAKILSLQEEIKAARKAEAEAKKDIARIERDMDEFKNNKGGKLAELQASLEKLKKASAKYNTSTKALQSKKSEAMVESENCAAELATAKEQLEDSLNTLRTLQDEIDKIMAEHAKAKDAHDLAKADLRTEQAKLTRFDDERRDIEESIRTKTAQIAEGKLEQQKLAHNLEKFQKDTVSAAQRLAHLVDEYDWVAEESSRFGVPNTPYDFNGVDMEQAKANRKDLQEQFQGMKNKINPKVMAMIDSVEKKEASLNKKMGIVIKDKKKIEETIRKLDDYKHQALHKAWTKVNQEFGVIFNDLLPGSFAKLEPPEGKTIMEGLEVKVMLGKVWKQSLTELSGGQRYGFYLATTSYSRCANTVQVPDCTVSDSRPSSVQTCAHVHSGRGGCCLGYFPHAKYRPYYQAPVQGCPVHRRQSEGRLV